MAIGKKYFEIADVLLRYGANIDATDFRDNTAFHHVTKGNSIENGEEEAYYLLRNGASLTAKDMFRHVPIELALKNNQFKICKMIMHFQN